jgi:hypothetical protein
MNLQQFISESLIQIARGVEQANQGLKDTSAKINPKSIATGGTKAEKIYGYLAEDAPDKFRKIVEAIDFDVAVYATEGTETKGGLELWSELSDWDLREKAKPITALNLESNSEFQCFCHKLKNKSWFLN